METTFSYGATLVGGTLDFPVFAGPPRPTQTAITKEQINSLATVQTIVPILGNVAYQVTGVYVDGINTTYPGTLTGAQENQSTLPMQGQQGMTGVLGGP